MADLVSLVEPLSPARQLLHQVRQVIHVVDKENIKENRKHDLRRALVNSVLLQILEDGREFVVSTFFHESTVVGAEQPGAYYYLIADCITVLANWQDAEIGEYLHRNAVDVTCDNAVKSVEREFQLNKHDTRGLKVTLENRVFKFCRSIRLQENSLEPEVYDHWQRIQ